MVGSSSELTWNRSAWFMLCFASMVWIMPLVMILSKHGDWRANITIMIVAVIQLALGCIFWLNRWLVKPYAAYQLWILISLVCSASILWVVQRMAADLTKDELGWSEWCFAILLIYPAISYQFWTTHRRFR